MFMAYKGKFADISAYQRHDLAYFQQLKADGFQGVVIKVTEGEHWVSPVWQAQATNALKVGMQVGVYHFARFSSVDNARTEARVFLNTVKGYGFDKTTVAMIDCETNDYHLSPQTYQAGVDAWLDEVKPTFPIRSVYANKDWWLHMLDPYHVDAIVWLAGYGITDFGGITNVGAWQHASSPLDTNWDYNGAFTRATSVPVTNPVNPTVKPAEAHTEALTGFTDDLGDYWFNETGTFTLDYPIVLRWGAKLHSSIITTLPAGSTIKYDAFSHHNGYVWLRQPRGNGVYGYLPSGHSQNGKRLDYWGKFTK